MQQSKAEQPKVLSSNLKNSSLKSSQRRGLCLLLSKSLMSRAQSSPDQFQGSSNLKLVVEDIPLLKSLKREMRMKNIQLRLNLWMNPKSKEIVNTSSTKQLLKGQLEIWGLSSSQEQIRKVLTPRSMREVNVLWIHILIQEWDILKNKKILRGGCHKFLTIYLLEQEEPKPQINRRQN